jgi:hypothetical protein
MMRKKPKASKGSGVVLLRVTGARLTSRKQRAERFLNEHFGNVRCIGCEKRPDQIGQVFTKGRALVCDSCVQELHKMMQDKASRRR